MALNYKPIVLVILDGFGIAPASQSNAITLAQKPFFDSLIKDYPSVLLQASSEGVGLPWGEVGNSEVGHLNIGSGILQYQSLPRINKSISTGQFFKMPSLQKIPERVKNKKGRVHVIGMLGSGGIHSSQEHLEGLVNFLRGEKIKKEVFFHLFTDGRDSGKNASKGFLEQFLKFSKKMKVGEVASIGGRSWGMDRNKNWDKIEKAYNAIVNGQAEAVHRDPLKALDDYYAKKIYDEELPPTVIVNRKNEPIATVEDGDTIIFFNFRADRARQLTESLVVPEFNKFARKKFNDLLMITFTEYKEGLPVEVLFPPEIVKNPITKIFSDYNIKQLHVAETEKYAHVTFFLNGRVEKAFAGEERILVPSPSVPTYDQQPEMSADKITDEVLKSLSQDKFGFIVINYANADMVGHTGNLKATIKAVESVDNNLKRLVPEVVKKGGIVFVVSDHGNAEEMFNPATGDIDKEHNMYPAPFIAISKKHLGQANSDIVDNDISLLTPAGILSDVTPTILGMSGLDLAPEMTGTCLFK